MHIDHDTPFRIAVLGDFTGRENRGVFQDGIELARVRPLRIDRDNFDAVMLKLGISLSKLIVAGEAGPETLEFRCLDDFHPDRLFQDLKLFASLRDVRDRLLSDADFEQAASEVLAWSGAEEQSATPTSEHNDSESAAADGPATTTSPDDLLDQMLDSAQQQSQRDAGAMDWHRLVQEIAAPYCLPDANPRQAELVACVDAATETTMRALLRHPGFQQLEAAWRALHLLVHRLETGPELQIYVIDISRPELSADLSAADDIRNSGLYRLLVEQTIETPGADPWAVLLGNYQFGPSDEDALLVEQLANVASAARAPLIAAAASSMVGCSGPSSEPQLDESRFAESQAWQQLRQKPAASHVALTWPRFLVRLPYGAQTRPIDEFAFEEIVTPPASQRLLWGSGVFVAGLLLGEAFSRSGWDMQPGDVNQVDGLPIWSYDLDEEVENHPCGEYLLTDRVVERLQLLGISPLLSIRDSDTVQLGGFYSLQSKLLAGHWSC